MKVIFRKPDNVIKYILNEREHKIDSSVFYDSKSRYLLKQVLENISNNDNVIVYIPSYICDIVPRTIKLSVCEYIYYEVDSDFQPILNTINLVNKKGVLITVNYFGISLNYDLISSYCKENNLIHINDNAHGFLSLYSGQNLDTFGDISITSYYKNTVALNGAYVKINNIEYSSIVNSYEKVSYNYFYLKYFKQYLRRLFYRAGLKKFANFKNINGFFENSESSKEPLDSIGILYCDYFLSYETRQKHLKIYKWIFEFFSSKRDYLLVNISENNENPMCVPVVVKNIETRNMLLDRASDLNIEVYTWPQLPKDVIENNIHNSIDRWEKLLCIQIHDQIEEDEFYPRLAQVFI